MSKTGDKLFKLMIFFFPIAASAKLERWAMKSILSVLIAISFLGCTTRPQVTLTTTSSIDGLNITTRRGKTYQGCHFNDVTLDGLQIRQNNQITTIDFRDLPADLQNLFQYDAKKGRRNPLLAAKEAYQAWQHRVAEHDETQSRVKVAEQQRRESNYFSATPPSESPRPSVPAPVKRSLPTLD